MTTPTPERSVDDIVKLAKEYADQVYLVSEENHDPASEEKALNNLVKAFQAERQRCEEMVEAEREQNILDTLTYDEAIKWWLDHYEGMEHMHVNPEAMYTITSILKRCFQALTQPNNK